MTTFYIIAGLAIVALIAAGYFYKQKNAPAVEEAISDRRKAWFDFRKYRLDRWFGRNKAPVDPNAPVKRGLLSRIFRRNKPPSGG